MCAFDWYQNHRPWMTLNYCTFKFSRNFALVGMFGRQQRLNEWRYTHIVSKGIVAHWKYFSTIYRLRWYCWGILSGGRFSELRTIYQGCRALPFALARLSCCNLLMIGLIVRLIIPHGMINLTIRPCGIYKLTTITMDLWFCRLIKPLVILLTILYNLLWT